MKKLLSIWVLAVLFVNAVVTNVAQPMSVRPIRPGDGPEHGDPTTLPARGGKVDWGLAVSGGGVRSGSYSIGVMKALYDVGFMDQVDAISTVSGGGFASYWLVGQNLNGPSGTFGHRSLGEKNFLEKVCSLKSGSQMFSKWQMGKAALSPRSRASENWPNAIHGTFGQDDPALYGTKLSELGADARGKDLPYWIINTSLLTDATRKLPPEREYEALVEMTPLML
jgi:hypothetical protein